MSRRTLFRCVGCRRQLCRDLSRIPERPTCSCCGVPMVRRRRRAKGGRPGALRARISRLLTRSSCPLTTADIGSRLCPDRRSPRVTVYKLLLRMKKRGDVRQLATVPGRGTFWVMG